MGEPPKIVSYAKWKQKTIFPTQSAVECYNRDSVTYSLVHLFVLFQIDKNKVDQNTLPEEYTFSAPMISGPTMAVEVKLFNEDNKPILETGPVVVNLPEPVSFWAFLQCILNEHTVNIPTETVYTICKKGLHE